MTDLIPDIDSQDFKLTNYMIRKLSEYSIKIMLFQGKTKLG